MDVKTTFLNGVIEEEVCVEQPKVLRHLIGSLKCADSSEHYTVSNRHPNLGTPGSTIISLGCEPLSYFGRR